MVSFTATSIAFAALFAAAVNGATLNKRESYQGIATFYTPGNDNCGTTSTEDDLVVAISRKGLYENNVNDEDISSYCGKHITATYKGKSVRAKVVDSCESCDKTHIDFSPAAFAKLADKDLGVIDVNWHFD